jgi:hypothetical protein
MADQDLFLTVRGQEEIWGPPALAASLGLAAPPMPGTFRRGGAVEKPPRIANPPAIQP